MIRKKLNNIKTAVAIKYDKSEIAPKVIAKGKGIVAENIIEKAKESNVEVYEDKKLANELINLELGQEIPDELYTTVAQVLAFIYSVDNKKGELIEESKGKQ